MSSSASINNLSCARCHQSQASLSEPLKLCGRCRTLHYCSTECQKLDWPKHKQQCRKGGLDSSTGPRVRQTMRLNLGDFVRQSQSESPAAPDSDTIYYLHTSTPHLHDISVSGPFYPMESIIPQVLNNFGGECANGGDTFLDMIGEEGLGVTSFEHLTSPINGDPNKTRTIRLMRERNAIVAAKLPGPAWYIVETELNMNPALMDRARTGQAPVPVKDIQVHKTFDNVEAANREAKALAASPSYRESGGRVSEMPDSSGRYCASIVTGRGTTQKIVTLQVQYDSGRIIPPS